MYEYLFCISLDFFVWGLQTSLSLSLLTRLDDTPPPRPPPSIPPPPTSICACALWLQVAKKIHLHNQKQVKENTAKQSKAKQDKNNPSPPSPDYCPIPAFTNTAGYATKRLRNETTPRRPNLSPKQQQQNGSPSSYSSTPTPTPLIPLLLLPTKATGMAVVVDGDGDGCPIVTTPPPPVVVQQRKTGFIF